MTPEPTKKPVELYVVRHAEWEAFVERETEAAYEALDNALDSIGLNGIIDARAGAFYHPKHGRIYGDEAVIKPALEDENTPKGQKGKELVKHEKGHEEKVANHDHPTKILPMLKHGKKVDYDYRAGTRLLRLKHRDRAPAGFPYWWEQQKMLYRTGKLVVQSAPPK